MYAAIPHCRRRDISRTVKIRGSNLIFTEKGVPMHRFTKAAALGVIAAILGACSGHSGGSLPPQAGTPQSTAQAPADNSDFTYNVNPLVKPFETGSAVTTNALPSPSQCVAGFGLACYTPALMRTAYNVPVSANGAGQTIVIVDAFGSPTIKTDIKTFDAVMGLPDPTLNVLTPVGAVTPNNLGWAEETSLDVEWAHAIAPAATIDLVLAPNNKSSSLHAAEQYAITNHLGSVISMSFGALEPSIPGGAHNTLLQHADSLYQQAKDAHITMIASTGDLGATNGLNAPPNPQFPASDPLVTSVSGTSLFMSDTGAYQHETVWNDSDASLCPFGCAYGVSPAVTGGAPSALFKAPSFQQMLFHPATREVGDVSYNAGTYTAVLVYIGFLGANSGFYFVGGTSAAAPQWAGIVALANQSAGHPLGYINQALYNVAEGPLYHLAFHDVTVGNNGLLGGASESAGPGYDMPTGLGSPNVANLIPALIQAAK